MRITNYLSNRFFNYLLLIGVSSFLNGCNIPVTKTEYSNILHEPARVSETIYTPSRHGSGTSSGPTIDFDGNIGFGFHSVDVTIPELWGVVFECQHGKFVSQGKDDRHKDLWSRLSEGDSVDVTYKEVFKVTYQDINNDKKKDEINRVLIEYDFLDAQITKKAIR